MRHTILNRNKSKASGFTLIEMLVVAPGVILLIGTLIAFLVALTGESLQAREKAKIIYATEETLKRFDEDTRFAIAFEDKSFPGIPDVQSSDSAGDEFDVIARPYPIATHAFAAKRILRTYATNKSPLDPTKSLIYSTSPDASNCGTAAESQNDPFEIEIIYYTKLDSGTGSAARYSLWRRVVHNPAQTVCPGSTPWQRPSCAPGVVNAACQTEDEKMLDSLPLGGVGGYYAHIPDRSWSPSAPYAPTHYIDCINPCPILNGTAGNPVFDPYSRDGSNNPIDNAEMTSLVLQPSKTVSGDTISYYATGYSRRQNAP